MIKELDWDALDEIDQVFDGGPGAFRAALDRLADG